PAQAFLLGHLLLLLTSARAGARSRLARAATGAGRRGRSRRARPARRRWRRRSGRKPDPGWGRSGTSEPPVHAGGLPVFGRVGDTAAAGVRHGEVDGHHPDGPAAGEAAEGLLGVLVEQMHDPAGVEKHRVEGVRVHGRTSSPRGSSPRSARDRATNAPSGRSGSLAARLRAASMTDTSAGARAWAPRSAWASQYGLPSAPCTQPLRSSRSHTAT